MNFGSKIQHIRINRGINQKEVANKLHVSRKTISHWETEKSYPDIYKLIDLSNYYNISIDQLIKEDNNIKKSLDINSIIKKIRPVNIIMLITDVIFLSLIVIGQSNITFKNHILNLMVFIMGIVNAIGLVLIANFQNELSKRIGNNKVIKKRIKLGIKTLNILIPLLFVITFISYFISIIVFYFSCFVFTTLLMTWIILLLKKKKININNI